MVKQLERVLVTGGAGFIGLHVVRELLGRDIAVRVLDLAEDAVEHLPAAVELIRGDVREPSSVADAIRGCDGVVHLAANADLWARDPSVFEAVNHQGTCNVLAMAADHRVGHIVHVSSETVLLPTTERPLTEESESRLKDQIGAYARSKWLADQAVWAAARRGAPVTIATPSVPVGPGDRHDLPLTRLIRRFLAKPMLGYMEGTMHLIDVRDVATGIVRSLEDGRIGARYLLTAETWTVGRLLGRLAAVTGRPPPRFRVPYPLCVGVALWEETRARCIGGEAPLATLSGVRLARCDGAIDASHTQGELGLEPRPVQDALDEAVAWLQGTMDHSAN